MKIKNKLSLQFTAIVTSMLVFSLIAIYAISFSYRESQYYDRIENRIDKIVKHFFDNDKQMDMSEISVRSGLINEHVLIFRNQPKYIVFENNPSSIPHDELDFLFRVVDEQNQYRFNIDKLEFIAEIIYTQESMYYFVLGAEDRFGHSKLKNLRITLAIVLIVIVIIALLSGRYFANKAFKPIVNIVDEVDKISVSELNKRIDEGKGKDEIELLAKTFNNMLERLEASFSMQENFVANASHEIRTPLALLKGQIELALNKSRDTDYYKNKLKSMLEDIERLELITNKLLLLANVSRDQNQFEFSPIRIDELLWQLRTELENQNDKIITKLYIKDIPENQEKLIIEANETLLKVAFNNIIENAHKYSNGKDVVIELQIKKSHVIVIFKDSGIGIPIKEVNEVFQAFFRASNVADIKGNGIGLSIVEKIINIHKGTINISSKINEGTTVKVSLPRFIQNSL